MGVQRESQLVEKGPQNEDNVIGLDDDPPPMQHITRSVGEGDLTQSLCPYPMNFVVAGSKNA